MKKQLQLDQGTMLGKIQLHLGIKGYFLAHIGVQGCDSGSVRIDGIDPLRRIGVGVNLGQTT